MKPLCIDLFCGLGGWAEGFLAEGYDVIGFDVERHDYGTGGYPGQLVLQDALTLDGRQFRNAAVIVASPPCQAYSYMAMPWSLAKAKAAAIHEDVRLWLPLTCLFNACFRIAHEAGVPLVVENVKGAQPWVGEARANFGSFYLWGDVNSVGGRIVAGRGLNFGDGLRPARAQKRNPDGTNNPQGSWFKIADSKERGTKNDGGSWFNFGSPGQTNVGQNPDGRKVPVYSDPRRNGGKGKHFTLPEENLEGIKQGGGWWHDPESITRRTSSHSKARKAASAQIAKIPFPLASYIARVFKP